MCYLAMICDIKNSRGIVHRELLQYQLIEALQKTNAVCADSIAAPFMVTAGDEWEGLLYPTTDYRKLLHFFRQELGEIDFYTGVGMGDITVRDLTLPVNHLDGPAFHKARNALHIAKTNHYSEVFIR